MTEKKGIRYVPPQYKVKVIRGQKRFPDHLPKILIGLTASLVVLASIKSGRKPTSKEIKEAAKPAMRGFLLL